MFSIDASELNAVSASLRGAGREAAERVGQATRKAAMDIRGDAQQFAPVDTGHLRGSIGTDIRDIRGGVQAEIGPTAHYGRYVEEGTYKMAPQPYMGPALDRHSGAWQQAIAQAASEAI